MSFLLGRIANIASGLSASVGRSLRLLGWLSTTVLLSTPCYAGSAFLQWDAPKTNTDGSALTDLASYRVSYGCSSPGVYPSSVTIPATATSYTLDGLTDVGACYFAVAAVNAKGVSSALSNEASKFMGVLPKPGKPSVTVTWQESKPVALTKAYAIDAGDGDSSATLTTGTFDSTGYTHIVIAFKHEGAVTTLTPSDNKGSSSWNSLTKVNHGNGDISVQMFWAAIGTPGTGHTATITLAAARPWKAMDVWLISAGTTLELDAETGAQSSGSAVDAGSLATTGVSVVSFMFVGPYNTGTYTPGSGWTEDFDGSSGANAVAHYAESRGPETTSPIDPTATWTNTDAWVSVAASLREAAGGGSFQAAWARGSNVVIGLPH